MFKLRLRSQGRPCPLRIRSAFSLLFRRLRRPEGQRKARHRARSQAFFLRREARPQRDGRRSHTVPRTPRCPCTGICRRHLTSSFVISIALNLQEEGQAPQRLHLSRSIMAFLFYNRYRPERASRHAELAADAFIVDNFYAHSADLPVAEFFYQRLHHLIALSPEASLRRPLEEE